MLVEKVSACIIAAGQSKRMGKTKQLLPLNGKPMLQHVIDKVLQGPFDKVYVVVGHDAERIMEAISVKDERLVWLVNQQFKKGQSTSLQTVFQHAQVTNMMIFLGDLPFIKLDTMDKVINSSIGLEDPHGPEMIRPSYGGRVGHPVLVRNVTEKMLAQLKGDQGFRMIQAPCLERKILPLQDPYVHYDIDTPEQYEAALGLIEEGN